MSRESFRTVVKALITYRGEILIGKKEEEEGHPISGEWHLLGGHLEYGEQVEEAIEREVEEETGLEVDVHQTVDVMTFAWSDGEKDSLQIVFHCESEEKDAEALDDLSEVKWVEPGEITDFVHSEEAERLEERKDQAQFLEKMEKAPF
ncbi:NUDIX domain-containing protein [Candidatus Nanohalovita haloferacivicina]|uniref:NUDIX domain-containing protein n=1 Tax=Candidatus Nanohalovita haloferacivicina TaxID=2978046 RepID=UPI00325FA912|nr:NUDIX family hydrolase [Candidatus Nanohalobia archaeon BNXNv]